MAEAERPALSATRRPRLAPAAVALTVALSVAACTGAPGGPPRASTGPTFPGAATATSATTPTTTSTRQTTATTTTRAAPPRVEKVLVFVVENHSAGQMSAQMPYAAWLGRRFAVATAYTALTHPSLPNYLAMAGGSTFGVRDDDGPSEHRLRGASVFGLALAHGRTAGTFVEGMTSDCQQQAQGRYAVKHNPWAYFVDERPSCRRFDRPLDALPSAIAAGRLPSVGMVIPDVCHDAHDCSLASADRWFAQWMGRVQAGPDWRAGRLLVVLTADEDDHHAGNRVLTVFAHPALHQRRVRAALDHYALARLLAEAGGTPAPRHAADAPSVADALGLAVG